MVMVGFERRARRESNARLLLGQRESTKTISGRTGGVAHVAESTDGNADALVVLVDADEGGWLWIVWRDWHGEKKSASQVYIAARLHVNTAA